ncbi:MAG: 50S ribosomal protein L9 [Myxococcota bacterium]
MASHVQVVLTEDVHNLGRTGDVVKVRPGYARNFLLPRGMAIAATRGNIDQIEHEKQQAIARAAKLREDAQGMAEALAEVTLHISKNAGEGGKLFGSVTVQEVAAALVEKGYQVDRRKILLPGDQPIKELGTHEVQVKLAPTVTATFTVEVTAAES